MTLFFSLLLILTALPVSADDNFTSLDFLASYSTLVADVKPDYEGRSEYGVGGMFSFKHHWESGFSFGFDYMTGRYSFRNWGYNSAYTVHSILTAAGYEIPIKRTFIFIVDVGAGFNYVVFEKQSGWFPAIKGSLGFGWNISKNVGVLADVGIMVTFQFNLETDITYYTPEIGLRIAL